MGQMSRWTDMLASLARSGQLTISETATRFAVSEATIRRDFDELARQGLLTRVRGGAMSNGLAVDLPLRYKTSLHAAEKGRIAAAAARLVELPAVIGLTGGTTTTALAHALAARPDVAGHPVGAGLTIVTNAVNIAYDLATRPDIKTLLVGGVLRQQSYELIGALAIAALEQLALDYCFLSADAINAVDGVMTYNDAEASVNRALAKRANHVVVVADGSKIGARAFTRITTVAEIDTLVTDAGAPPDALGSIADAGCEIIQA